MSHQNNSALRVLMKGPDDVEDPGWTSYHGEHLEEAISAHQFGSLCDIYEGNKQWQSFPAFLLQLSEGEDVSSGPVCPEFTLLFWTDSPQASGVSSVRHRQAVSPPHRGERCLGS